MAYKQSLRTEELRLSSTWEEERRHVRGLPDVLPPIPAASGASGEGGIIAKIAASRKERHEAAVEDMRQELAGISAVRPLSSLSIEHCTHDDQMNEATYANWLVSWLICLEIESHFIISSCFSTHTHTGSGTPGFHRGRRYSVISKRQRQTYRRLSRPN